MQPTNSGDVRIAVVVGELASTTVLSGVRALAAAGWQVHAAGGGDTEILHRSRAVTAVHRLPAPAQDPLMFVQSVRELLQRLGRPVVLPAGDAELVMLAISRDAFFAGCGIPAREVVGALLDKERLAGAAAAVGLATPRTGVTAGGPPVVVKSVVHFEPGRREGRWEARVAATPAALRHTLREAADAGVLVTVQQFVPGRLMALTLVLDRQGVSLGRSQQESTVTWPREAGRSARAVTVPVDGPLAEASRRLLSAAGWHGLAQLQFLHAPGARPVLIDVNPRLYGSVALAVAAGACLPDLAARVLRGEQVTAVPDARPGVRYRWLEGDLRAAFTGPARRRDLTSALRPARGRVGPVWDPRDPRPALVASRDLAWRALRRRSS